MFYFKKEPVFSALDGRYMRLSPVLHFKEGLTSLPCVSFMTIFILKFDVAAIKANILHSFGTLLYAKMIFFFYKTFLTLDL